MTDTYRLAGLCIRVTSVYGSVHRLCRDYRAEAAADFAVETTREDIDFERQKSAQADAPRVSDGYLETLAVYRKIAEKLPAYGTVLMHGSCVAVDGEGYLFLAPSGTGKSTHTRLWRELFGGRALMVNDDKPLVHVGDTETLACGTPWDGKHHLSANVAVPLRAICLLGRAAENTISPISACEAFPTLVRQTYRPADPAALDKTLTLLDQMKTTVRFFRLGCNMEPEAARIAYEGMKG
jgi:hypothetical protein